MALKMKCIICGCLTADISDVEILNSPKRPFCIKGKSYFADTTYLDTKLRKTKFGSIVEDRKSTVPYYTEYEKRRLKNRYLCLFCFYTMKKDFKQHSNIG